MLLNDTITLLHYRRRVATRRKVSPTFWHRDKYYTTALLWVPRLVVLPLTLTMSTGRSMYTRAKMLQSGRPTSHCGTSTVIMFERFGSSSGKFVTHSRRLPSQPMPTSVLLCLISDVHLDSFICVPWLSHMCTVTHSYVCRDWLVCVPWLIPEDCRRQLARYCYSFMSVPGLIHTCAVTHSYVYHDSLICVPWLIHTCTMTHSYVYRDAFIYGVSRPTHLWCTVTHWYLYHDSFILYSDPFICVLWLIDMCNVTHSYMYRDSCICVTCHIHMLTVTVYRDSLIWGALWLTHSSKVGIWVFQAFGFMVACFSRCSALYLPQGSVFSNDDDV